MDLILTPYADHHGPDSLTGWADYLHRRGDVPDETVIAAVRWTASGLRTCAVVYRADPPRLELVGEANG